MSGATGADNKGFDTDVLIAGGGLAGATLALALGRALAHLRVTVVEAFPLPAEAPPDHYQPSYDARSTALAWGSRLIYEDLGLWPRLAEHATPIRHIHVSDRGHFGATRLAADEHGQEALGYVVDNRWLGLSLMAALRGQRGLTWLAPAEVTNAEPQASGVSVSLLEDGVARTMTAQCLVVADGGRSGLRERLGFKVDYNDYGQHGLIANVSTSDPHEFVAYERFTDAGPMALLPSGGPGRADTTSSLVWTLAGPQLDELLACNDRERCARLQERFGWRLGRFTRVGTCQHYPLVLSTVTEAVRPGIALVGNAAHTLHPVAGQGFNLALRGLMTLVEQFRLAAMDQRPLGSLKVLGAYQAAHRADWQRTVRFSDSLIRIFGSNAPGLTAARDMGLVGLDLLPAAKRFLARQAMGLGGRKSTVLAASRRPDSES
jgi:2-octaprenyl-6-methoxyphenol hydroxylase